MTLDADILFSPGEKLIRRRGDTMVAVAGLALRDPERIKGLFVGAFREQVARARMALPADKRDGADFGRSRAVVAVAVIAHRGAEVLFLEKGPGMDALLVIIDLLDGYPVSFHGVGARMAAAAGLRDVPGEDLRFGEAGRLDAVDSVAVRADGAARISLFQEPAVLACPVEDQLVHPQVGIEAPHIF